MLDSGSHAVAFEKVVCLTRESAERVRAKHAGDERVRIGYAAINYIEGAAPSYFPTTGHWTSQDSCAIAFYPDGTVVVRTGVSSAVKASGRWWRP